jgi:hypothetical protein
VARASCIIAAGVTLLATNATAQNRPCQLELLNVDRTGIYVNVAPGVTNYFAGGNVRMKCRGQNVKLFADSVASYQGTLVQFIGHFRYDDGKDQVSSDFGTYYKDNERWEARGNVDYQNLKDGSQLKGPSADYYRRIKGTRELEELYADQRPTLTIAARDSAGRRAEPYVIVGDRVRMKGEDLMWAGGAVTIDRSDLRGRGDSLQMDTGKAGAGALIRHAAIRRAAQDSFALAGKRIDFSLVRKELTGIVGRDSATLTSKDFDLSGDAISLALEARTVKQTLAWGTVQKPRALSDDYEVRGDSIAIDTPKETLKELRSFRHAWVGFKPDSAKGERDWLAGEAIVASFGQRSTPSGSKSQLQRLEATQSARSFYRIAQGDKPGARPSINYSTADKIVLTLQPGDSVKVEKVEMTGHVEGTHLQPKAPPADTTRPKKP